jgi:serine/threonine-protein kinase RsbW
VKAKKFNLPSRVESVDQAAQAATEFATAAGFDEAALYAVDMAVRETVANAVKHGNEFDETKSVEIAFEDLPEGLQIMVRDFGKGFAVNEIPDPTNQENLLKASGRGILFMRSFMDKVEWSNSAGGGMIVKMLKKR